MASVFNRGSASAPRWYARFKDASGSWCSVRVRQQTREAAVEIAIALEAKAERQRVGIAAPDSAEIEIGGLLEQWARGLENLSARDDRSRTAKHLIPRFGGLRLGDMTVEIVNNWLQEIALAGAVAPGTQRHLLNLLSRFFNWTCACGLTADNPAKKVPARLRPSSPLRYLDEGPWIEDDAVVRQIMAALPEPINLIFFIGNRSGLWLSEILGLRLSDLSDIERDVLYVRHKYDHATRERQAAMSTDGPRFLGPWRRRRRVEGAAPEAFVFARADGAHLRKEFVEWHWERVGRPMVTARLGKPAMTFTRATRESFALRKLGECESVKEVAGSMGVDPIALIKRLRPNSYRLFSVGMLTPIGGSTFMPVALRSAG